LPQRSFTRYQLPHRARRDDPRVVLVARRRGDRVTRRNPRASFAAMHESGSGRFCCKSLFALAIKNSFGRRRDFHVKMWGTSSPEDKLTGDLGNVIEVTSIGGRRSDFFPAGKLAPSNLGLLQQYRHKAAVGICGAMSVAGGSGLQRTKRLIPALTLTHHRPVSVRNRKLWASIPQRMNVSPP
jgi:hypothetical protein